MRWNIIVGVAAAALAFAQLAIMAVGYFDPDHLGAGYGDMLFTVVSIIALLLTYPLLRGRNWARVSLLIVLVVCGAGVALLVPFSFIANHWIYTRLAIAASSLPTMLIFALLIVILLHPDVRRDFTQLPRQTV